jgi:uncharacterized protein YbjT (DUF2867 family)
MYAITGITGNVGGSVAHHLLAAGRSVRAVMRDIGKGDVWTERGCEVVKADIADATLLASAFRGAEAVFVLVPPNFNATPGFPEARATAASLKSALERTDPGRAVYLSTIGAQAGESNLLTQHTIIEQVLGELPMLITFLRPAWFMEEIVAQIYYSSARRVWFRDVAKEQRRLDAGRRSDVALRFLRSPTRSGLFGDGQCGAIRS